MSDHSRSILRGIGNQQFDPEILSTNIDDPDSIWSDGKKLEVETIEQKSMQNIHDITIIYFEKYRKNFLEIISKLNDENMKDMMNYKKELVLNIPSFLIIEGDYKEALK